MTNVFENMENKETPAISEKETKLDAGEVDYEKLSDVPVGEKTKYERPNLDGKIVKVAKFQVFNADTSEEPVSAMNDPAKKYYKSNIVMTYDCRNKDDIFDREYISGAIQFVNKDGTLSPHSFWYPGAENQCAKLWELVANFKGVKPEELSPREFVGTLNSGVKVKLSHIDIKFKGEVHHKNMPVEIVKE